MTPISNTVPTLPRLGIGCGTVALGAAQEDFRRLVAAATTEKNCYLDTAPLYANGESEARLGEALTGIARDSYILSTKTGRYPASAGTGRGVIPSWFDYTREGTLRSIETSLARLGCDRLDMVFLHDLDEKQHGQDYAARLDEAMAGAVPALRDLQRQGIVGVVGIASMRWEACLEVVRIADLDIVLLAGGATLLDRFSDPLFDHCAERSVPVIVASPLNSGILATGAIAGARYNYAPASPEIVRRVVAMEAACQRFDVPLVAAALRYPGRRHRIASLLVGHGSVEEFRQNETLLDLDIPEALWDELERL
ncbi:MAG: aldo/keto reductase [Rhodospirillum sp.]|nr:aldo/keto reductase [Rhodospirillum sp.]MCF8489733.1 aldo/keto reductase [Rhodospirillum sp.]